MKNYKITYYLPEKILKNQELANCFGDWTDEQIYSKTGIKERHIANDEEFSSDLAIEAANKLLKEYEISINEIDFLLLVTQSADYTLPNNSAIVHSKIGMRSDAGAIDINQGCSGFIYGLSVAEAMIKSSIVKNVLIITTDTYTKYIHEKDKSVRTLFGDGAAATFISEEIIDNKDTFNFGTDGSHYDKFIIPASGLRIQRDEKTKEALTDKYGFVRSKENIFMDGHEILMFTKRTIPKFVYKTLEKANMELSDIDLFVFHQASKPILELLKMKLNIAEDRFFENICFVGNTVSSSIPIALKDAELQGKLFHGDTVMLVGFGVGLSWGAAIIKW